MKDKIALIDKIQEAVAEYCYEHKELNLKLLATIDAKNGWVQAKIKEL